MIYQFVLYTEMERKEFEILFCRLRPAIYKMAYGVTNSEDDAEDVAQDTLLKLWSMRDKLEGYRSTEALALVMSRRMSIDKLRQRKNVPLEDVDRLDLSPTPEEVMMHKEAEAEMDMRLQQLPDREQAVLRMRHIDGLEIGEIAKLIGTSEVNVRVAISRGRRRIKDLFLTQNTD